MATTALNTIATAGFTTSEAFNKFTLAMSDSASAMNTAITGTGENPGDPTNLIKMQVAMANYQLSISVTSSVIKSIEETAKSITQKL